jgi:hypothetical protein
VGSAIDACVTKQDIHADAPTRHYARARPTRFASIRRVPQVRARQHPADHEGEAYERRFKTN